MEGQGNESNCHCSWPCRLPLTVSTILMSNSDQGFLWFFVFLSFDFGLDPLLDAANFKEKTFNNLGKS